MSEFAFKNTGSKLTPLITDLKIKFNNIYKCMEVKKSSIKDRYARFQVLWLKKLQNYLCDGSATLRTFDSCFGGFEDMISTKDKHVFLHSIGTAIQQELTSIMMNFKATRATEEEENP